MHDFEVLAPAGNLEIFKSVIDAGADAVYFGGSLFSARAYANNFDFDESIEALNYAHLHNKKAYLTLNTIIKNKEFDDKLYDYIRFYYENGLDGVIVQDIGVVKYIRDNFPNLCVHGSTQMAICNSYGAKLCKELGMTRVVPARELSFDEISAINKNVDIELEVFVHGALCYCYSGDCLMSSLIGGRSGNRGRCAQPCRLEYDVLDGDKRINSKGSYVLSLKDLCGINELPMLYKSGVSSLKIEGRMKQKQYASNVVNVYRRYVDMLLDNISKGNDEYFVDKEDEKLLLNLGNRCGFTNKYYYGKKDDMVTFTKPSHESKEITYEFKEDKLPVNCFFKARINEPIEITITLDDISVHLQGINTEAASKKPVTQEDIDKRLRKTGNTSFEINEIIYDVDDNIFIPLGEVGKIRRAALDMLKDDILMRYKRDLSSSKRINESIKNSNISTNYDNISTNNIYKTDCNDNQSISSLLISISNTDQLEALESIKELNRQIDFDIVIPVNNTELFNNIKAIRRKFTSNKVFAKIPEVLRDKALRLLEDNIDTLKLFDGFYISSYDALQFVKDNNLDGTIIAGSHIYTFNNNSINAISELGVDFNVAPLELNNKELSHRNNDNSIITIYGKYPMMITNNCVNSNCLKCDNKEKDLKLRDKKGHSFLVRNNCKVCYNVIYNEFPTSLLDEKEMIEKAGFSLAFIEFVDEDKERIIDVLDCYLQSFVHESKCNIDYNYTKGHFKRGVE